MIKNADCDKDSYSGHGIIFDPCGFFPLSHGSGLSKNAIIFGVDNSSFEHTDYRKKDILIIGKDPLHGFNGAKTTAEAEYCINFHDQQNELLKFNISFLFVNGMIINQYTAKDFEIYKNALCLGNISKDFAKKTLKINIEKKARPYQ